MELNARLALFFAASLFGFVFLLLAFKFELAFLFLARLLDLVLGHPCATAHKN